LPDCPNPVKAARRLAGIRTPIDPHPKMPNVPLTRAEAADLAAYVATLR
jgi:mono/diheme cytochrome c family protein